MDLDSHKKTLGFTHLTYGLLTAVVFIFIGSIASIFVPYIQDAIIEQEGPEAEKVVQFIIGIIRTVFLLLFIFSAVPSVVAGLGLSLNKSWGVTISMVAGCLALLNFPFGTVVGVYSIYVFIQHNNQRTEAEG